MNLKTKNFRAGTVIFRENDQSSEMYIIQTGRVKITKKVQSQDVVIGEFGPRDILGEMSLLDGLSRSATAEAVTDTTVHYVTPEEFDEKTRTVPSWFLALLKTISKRLRSTDRRLKYNIWETDLGNISNLLCLMHRKQPGGAEAGIDLKAAKKECLELLTLSQKQTERILDYLNQKKLVRMERNSIHLPDPESLRKFAVYLRKKRRQNNVRQTSQGYFNEGIFELLGRLVETVKKNGPLPEGEKNLSLDAAVLRAEYAASGKTGEFERLLQDLAEGKVIELKETPVNTEKKATPEEKMKTIICNLDTVQGLLTEHRFDQLTAED
jgi:CRP-like cAMP-binding protein